MSEAKNGHESVYAASDWDILKYVHQMLADGNVLNTTGDKPIVSFKYPDELQVRHDIQIKSFRELSLTNLMFNALNGTNQKSNRTKFN